MSYRFADSLRAGSGRQLSANLYDIPLLCVQWKTPDDGQRNCPKHVEFYSKNKLEKSLRLIGFIIRIYHDARSPERQICGTDSIQVTEGRKYFPRGPHVGQPWSSPRK